MTLKILLVHHLQNIYAAEDHILQAMPNVIERANHKSLKNALKHHLGLSLEQKKRLEQSVQLINDKKTAAAKAATLGTGTSKGMAGLIEEVDEILHLEVDKDVVDSAIISYVQKIEHYEICAYCLRNRTCFCKAATPA